MSEDSTNETAAVDQSTAPESLIKILKGQPTDAEVAALIGVLSGVGGAGGGEVQGPQAIDLWGHPVGKLRYQTYSWQRVTLLERTYLRR